MYANKNVGKKKEINSGAKEFSEQNLKYDREP